MQFKPVVFEKLKTLRQILAQQKYHYDQPNKAVSHPVVSFHKPYLRPVVMGKENKPVEFGAKVHQLAVDGIYATNRNPKWCRTQKIATSFIPKESPLPRPKFFILNLIHTLGYTLIPPLGFPLSFSKNAITTSFSSENLRFTSNHI